MKTIMDYYHDDSFNSNDPNPYQGIDELSNEQQHDDDDNINKLNDYSQTEFDDNQSKSKDAGNESSNNRLNSQLSPIDKIKEKMIFEILPEDLPRPNRARDKFLSREGTNTYFTNIKETIYHPNANSNYKVLETDNSSIKLIRPSFHIISRSRDFHNRTMLPFGLCIEPFNDEVNIQSIIVDPKHEMVICNKCGGYYTKHSMASISNINDSEKSLIFNCCLCGNYISVSSSIYFWKEFTQVSVDYLFPNAKCVAECEMFIIDVSVEAIRSHFSSYIVESIKNSISTIGEAYKRRACIAAVDEQEISFYYLLRHSIRMIKVNDLNDPFIPLPSEALFSDLKAINDILDAIKQQITKQEQMMTMTSRNRLKNVNLLEALIKSTIRLSSVNQQSETYYHIIILLNNPSTALTLTNTTPKGFLSNNQCDNLLKSNTKVSYDVFIVSSNHNQIHNKTLLYNQNYSNPNIIPHYYQANSSIKDDTYLQYERLYYDLFNLINSPRYCNIQFNIITQEEFGSNLLSPYPIRIVNRYPHIISSTNSLMVSYEIVHKVKELQHQSDYSFQFWMTYTNLEDNYRHHRIFSYKCKATNTINALYSSIDISALLPIIIHDEVKRMLTANKTLSDLINLLNENIEKILFKALYDYKTNVYTGDSYDSLSFPLTLSCLPLFLYSFTKLKLFRLFKLYDQSQYHNAIYSKLYSLLHCPIKNVPSQLYAQMLLLDKEEVEEIPLSIFFIEMNMSLLYDDGEVVTLFLMKGFDEEGKDKEITNGCSSNDSIDKIKESILKAIDQYSHGDNKEFCNKHLVKELFIKQFNRVFNVEVIDNKTSILTDFLIIFKEDSLFIGEKSYEEFIWNLKQKIMAQCLMLS